MSASKDDVIRTIRASQEEIEKVASALPETAWPRGVYEAGWNAKQLLCHLVENSGGVATFLIGLAKSPARADTGTGIDIDVWNARRVAALQDKPVSELLNDLRTNCKRAVANIEAAPNDLLSRPIQTPWYAEGPLSDIIVQSIQEHCGMHLADLRSATTG